MKYETKTSNKFPRNIDIPNNKDKLLKQFIDNTTKSSKIIEESTPINNDETLKNSTETTKLKNRIKDLEKQVELYKGKYKELNSKKSKEQVKIDKYYNLYALAKAESEELLKHVEVLKNDKIVLYNKFTKIYAEKSALNYKVQDLENRIIKLRNNNKSTSGALSTIHSAYGKKLRDKEQELDNSLQKIKKLENTICVINKEIWKLNLTISQKNEKIYMIEMLNNSYETANRENEKQKSNLIIFVNFLKSKINFMINDIKFRYRAYKRNKNKLLSRNERIEYGYVKYSRFIGYKFISIDDDKEYKAKLYSKINISRSLDGAGCVASIKNNNKVTILCVYKSDKAFLEHRQKDITTKQKYKKEIEKIYTNSPKILIITALPKSKYITRLNGAGLDIEYFNSYSQKAKRLNSILSKYELVFYCTQHSKHYVKNVFKNQSDYPSDKYLIIKDDSIRNILYHIDKHLDKCHNKEIEEIASDKTD